MEEEFDWPCYIHNAHKEHALSTEEIGRLTDRQLARLVLDNWDEVCLGVKAHPNTMIGGANGH